MNDDGQQSLVRVNQELLAKIDTVSKWKLVARAAVAAAAVVSLGGACTHAERSSPTVDPALSPELAGAMDRAASRRPGQDLGRAAAPGPRAADGYMTEIARIWNAHWSLPREIDRDLGARLFALIIVRVDSSWNVVDVEFRQASGNQLFDRSIRDAWRQIARLPTPPRDRAASILVDGLRLSIRWAPRP
jgi:outer membrane biosynthesis protein TonB